jgi:hypothetical protein
MTGTSASVVVRISKFVMTMAFQYQGEAFTAQQAQVYRL